MEAPVVTPPGAVKSDLTSQPPRILHLCMVGPSVVSFSQESGMLFDAIGYLNRYARPTLPDKSSLRLLSLAQPISFARPRSEFLHLLKRPTLLGCTLLDLSPLPPQLVRVGTPLLDRAEADLQPDRNVSLCMTLYLRVADERGFRFERSASSRARTTFTLEGDYSATGEVIAPVEGSRSASEQPGGRRPNPAECQADSGTRFFRGEQRVLPVPLYARRHDQQ